MPQQFKEQLAEFRSWIDITKEVFCEFEQIINLLVGYAKHDYNCPVYETGKCHCGFDELNIRLLKAQEKIDALFENGDKECGS